jgi:hypothetical protein
MEVFMKEIKLGVIGLSPGNGHPYSWSAIFNGYNPDKMQHCPFPVIYNYLKQHQFPEEAIPGAKVTHIWTQDVEVSRKIAAASKIDNVVAELTDMVTEVDAVLLARDDAENHFEMAKPFLQAGLPVFIDKPLAYTLTEARRIIECEKYPGQLFTCSSFRFSKDLSLSPSQRSQLGTIQHVIGHVPKDWKKYSIHIIDPVLMNLGDVGDVIKFQRWAIQGRTTLSVLWASGVQGTFFNFEAGAAPIKIQFIGSHGAEELIFKDTFQAFKSSLEQFILSVVEKRRIIPLQQTYAAIDLIEKGLEEIREK